MAKAKALRFFERGLFATALVLLGVTAFGLLDLRVYQAYQDWRISNALDWSFSRRSDSPVAANTRNEVATSGLVGRLEIPRLEISAIVSEGEDEKTLRRAVGHLPGTPFPGEPGNVALAAHRDSFFRSLEDIRADDRVRFLTPDGLFEYAVESISIVPPERVDVLEPTRRPTLTLVTCYPFRYVGNAPQRFVVRARLVGTQQARLAAVVPPP